jgi:hypothetical protein
VSDGHLYDYRRITIPVITLLRTICYEPERLNHRTVYALRGVIHTDAGSRSRTPRFAYQVFFDTQTHEAAAELEQDIRRTP